MALTNWRHRKTAIGPVSLLILCWQSAAQNPGGSQPPGPAPESGPYKAVMEMDAGLPGHTIYRPDDLAGLKGASLPIVIWGNGACVNVGNAFHCDAAELPAIRFPVGAVAWLNWKLKGIGGPRRCFVDPIAVYASTRNGLSAPKTCNSANCALRSN